MLPEHLHAKQKNLTVDALATVLDVATLPLKTRLALRQTCHALRFASSSTLTTAEFSTTEDCAGFNKSGWPSVVQDIQIPDVDSLAFLRKVTSSSFPSLRNVWMGFEANNMAGTRVPRWTQAATTLWPSLNSIHMHRCPRKVFESFMKEQWQTLHTLNVCLPEGAPLKSGDVDFDRALPALRILSIHASNVLIPPSILEKSTFPHLQSLLYDFDDDAGSIAPSLSKAAWLKQLVVLEVTTTPDVACLLHALDCSTVLEKLKLSLEFDDIVDDGGSYEECRFPPLPSLRSLYLGRCLHEDEIGLDMRNITAAFVHLPKEHLPNLNSLALRGFIVRDGLAEALGGLLDRLKTLKVTHGAVEGAELEILIEAAKNITLTTSTAAAAVITPGTGSCSRCSSTLCLPLEVLDLQDNEISQDDDFQELLKFLMPQRFPDFKTLKLNNNNLPRCRNDSFEYYEMCGPSRAYHDLAVTALSAFPYDILW